MKILRYVNKRLTQLRRDKASPIIVSEGERELMKMKTFLTGKGILALAAVVLLCVAGKPGAGAPPPPPATPWVLYKWTANGTYVASGQGTNFVFPESSRKVNYPVFVTTTTVTNCLGNLSGKTVTATMQVSLVDDPIFTFGGQLSGWNTGPLPAHARVFISSSAAGYSASGYTACPSCYWWHSAYAAMEDLAAGGVLVADFDPAHWTNAEGQSGLQHVAEFNAVVANVRQIGLSFGGGSFYDVGVAVLAGTGGAGFGLLGFSVQ